RCVPSRANMTEQATDTVLAAQLRARFGDTLSRVICAHGETTIELAPDDLLTVGEALRDEPTLRFASIIDVCGVDYLGYGQVEWGPRHRHRRGFSRRGGRAGGGRFGWGRRAAGRLAAPGKHFFAGGTTDRARPWSGAGQALRLGDPPAFAGTQPACARARV